MSSNLAAPPATADILGLAITEAQRGDLKAACARAEQGLADGGDIGPLNAFIGMLQCRMGDLEAGARSLAAAHKAQPDDVTVACNLIAALIDQDRFADAFAVATDELAATDGTYRIARYRAFLALSLGQAPVATEWYERILAAFPGEFESLNNLGNARLSAGDAAGAVTALEQAVGRDPESAPTQLNLANALIAAGEADRAAAVLRATADRFRDDPVPLDQLSTLLKSRGRHEEALMAITAAVRRDPTSVALLIKLGNQLGTSSEMDRAEQAFLDALTSDPGNGQAYFGLAVVYEYTNRVDRLRELVVAAEKASIPRRFIQLIRAMGLRRERSYEEGLEALEEVGGEIDPLRYNHLKGQFMDGLGRSDEAFEAFARMNAIQAEDPSNPLQRAADYRQSLRDQRAALTDEWIESWQPGPRHQAQRLAFLVGFPRSGTTLLDTMLMGHPDAAVMEERPAINTIEREIGAFDSIPTWSADQINHARGRYFEEASRYVDFTPGQLLVDKNPLYLNRVPTIRRLFPEAKFILALRHPCDVLLSCFIANFRPNTGMANFLRLEDAAELYDLTFGYWEQAREVLGPEVHQIRYEDVTGDAEAQLRPLVNFLGLDWEDSVLDHQKTASERGVIRTASYAQVQEPLYRRSVGRWERYRKHLAPVLPTLRPWAERYGYTI